MMDFNQMVRNVLFEADAGGEDQQEELYREGLAAFVKLKFPELQTIFQKQYTTTNKFIGEADIVPLVSNVTYGAGKTRSGGYDKDQIEQIFPLYDFVAYLYENYFKGKVNPTPSSLEEAFKKFKTTLEKSSKIPLEFPAMSSWGKNVKEDYTQLSKQEIGKIKFEALNPKLSFWAAIKSLLESYQKAKFTFTPQWMDKLQGVTSIEKIFSDPNIAKQGKFVFNDEKLNSLYDSLSKQTIINLAIAAYRLYVHQLVSNVTDADEVNKLKTDSVQFQQFMGTKAPGGISQEIFWIKPQVVGAGDGSRIGESMSFDEIVGLLSEELLIEGELEDRLNAALAASQAARQSSKFQGSAAALGSQEYANRQARAKGQALTPQEKANQRIARKLQDKKDKAAAAEAAAPKPPVVTQFDGTKPGMFLYNIENLKKPSQIPEVAAFIKALQDLANKLKSKSTPDILGTATALVQAASLGVKNMGT